MDLKSLSRVADSSSNFESLKLNSARVKSIREDLKSIGRSLGQRISLYNLTRPAIALGVFDLRPVSNFAEEHMGDIKDVLVKHFKKVSQIEYYGDIPVFLCKDGENANKDECWNLLERKFYFTSEGFEVDLPLSEDGVTKDGLGIPELDYYKEMIRLNGHIVSVKKDSKYIHLKLVS